ncbi:biotin-dependent carboxyltransferase family protein [Tamlana sp. 62-3]|uniref:Biotin-dependent carboxyltransferase family protein n=1 Tax=Neotamlana sargassicola TaxID=2883125 RepID=A0A9X1L6Z1_9FLAO|nr:biotin-dependent carboxyltransferase family protein [Tamlana sargassicola]MCB4808266.1 biotin-dependent carboxyltransferase family protein [Tamlana sargassicola]
MLRVLNAGFYSSIQDFGRPNFQEFGVPISGVMDRKAAAFANALLGNKANKAVLEMTMLGAKLQFEKATLIAIAGADMLPKLNDAPISINKAIFVNAGDVLSFGKLKQGFRTYLAVMGEFKTTSVLGSKSMFLGITDPCCIKKGDVLTYNSVSFSPNPSLASIKYNNDYLNQKIINVFKGPEFYLLSQQQKRQLLSQQFTVSKNNNRMAYQLVEIFENTIEPIITSPVLPGTVQLTPSGELIVLMRDCQTTGGYPRVLQLTGNAINILSQKFTGATFYFKFKA